MRGEGERPHRAMLWLPAPPIRQYLSPRQGYDPITGGEGLVLEAGQKCIAQAPDTSTGHTWATATYSSGRLLAL